MIYDFQLHLTSYDGERGRSHDHGQPDPMDVDMPHTTSEPQDLSNTTTKYTRNNNLESPKPASLSQRAQHSGSPQTTPIGNPNYQIYFQLKV